MTALGFGLSSEQLAAVFPFHVGFDRDLTIVQLGSAWGRVVPGLTVGSRFADNFRIVRPSLAVDFDTLRAQPQTIFMVDCVARPLPLRGQMLSLDETGVVLFLCWPWVTDLAELAPLGVSLGDLPPHQPLSDLLFLLQSQNTALADTKKLAERLAAQRTELRQANEQLFATRARLEHLFASSATVVFSTRLKPDLAVTFVSDNITSLLGYDMAQLGDPSSLMQRVHPQDLPLFRQQRRRVLTDGAAAAEYRIRHADGHYRWIHEQLRLNRDEAGEPLEVVGSWVEVSERKRAEQALEESEATLRAIVDHAAEAIITIEEDATVRSFNTAASHIFGYEPAEVIGRNVSMLMPPPDRERHDAYIARYLVTGESRVIGTGREVYGQRKDGSRCLLHLAISEVHSGGRRVFAGVLRDLTDQERAARALRESESRFRQIIDTALDAVIGMDVQGNITVWSKRAEAMFGWSCDEAVGRPWAETVIPPEHREGHRQGLRQFLATGEWSLLNRRIETTLVRRDGQEFPVEMAVAVLESQDAVSFGAFVRDITERKHAEAALQESEERLNLALTGAELGLWDLRLETKQLFLRAGATTTETFRLSGTEEQWRQWNERRHVDDRANVARAMQEHLEGRAPFYEAEFRARDTTGAWRWYHDRGKVAEFAADGRPLRVIGVYHDITRRKRSEQAVAVQLAVTSRLAEAANLSAAAPKILEAMCEGLGWEMGAIWTVDPAAQRLRCAYVWTLPGLTLATFVTATREWSFEPGVGLPGRVWVSRSAEWISDVAGDANFPRWQAAAGDGVHAAVALPLKVTDTFFGVAEVFCREIRQPDRDMLHMLESLGSQIGQFIERTHSAEALRASEERTRLIVDTALDAVISINAAGTITEWNRQAEAIFGWSASEALGRALVEMIIPPQYRGAHLRGMQHFLETGEGTVINTRVEITALQRDGREFPVELAVTPLRRRDSVDFSAFVRDITARKQAESDLAQAKDAAEAASQAKSRFLATMSHEIRTPLNPIIGMTGVLLSGDLEPEQRRYVDRIRQSGQLLLQRINEIIDFSKVEAGRIELEQIDFDLPRLLRRLEDLFAQQAHEKHLEWQIFIGSDVPRLVRGDPGRLQQILSNLVANALKFTERGHVWVRVARLSADDHTTTVRFAVEDTGIGVPAAKRDSVFEAFTQADASTTREFGGSGLGLSIAKELVHLMGGTIGVDPGPQQGSCFWFTVPLAAAAGAVETMEEAPAVPLTARRQPPSRILLAEDNPANQEVVTVMLERLGHRVDIASDGVEAVAAVQRVPYDVVLMDCQMPRKDGFEATRDIRRDEGRERHVPIIAMTASATRGYREQCLQAGMDDYLAKPVQYEELIAMLDKWLVEAGDTRRAEAVERRVLDQLRALESPKRPQLVKRLIERFLAATPTAIADMQQAAAAKDWGRLQRVAHDLKSDSGNLGASAMSALCSELQEAARAGREADSVVLVSAIPAEFQRVRAQLEAYLVNG